MLYVVHDQGRISQVNKVYEGGDLGEYEARMRAAGMSFIRRDLRGLIDAEAFHVSRDGRLLTRRPMLVKASAERIRAGGNEQIVLRGLPSQARVVLHAGAFAMLDEVVKGGAVALAPDTPGVFSVRIEAFPFLPWSGQFEVVT